MIVRKANLEDLEQISNIENSCFPPQEAASFARQRERFAVFSDLFFVLEVDNKIVGFINGMSTDRKTIVDEMFEKPNLHTKNGKWNSIFSLAILPEYQKNGYSKVLMNAYIENARQNKKLGCTLTCKDRLIKYYEKLGYKNYGISKSVHGNCIWYDMVLEF